MFSIKIEHVHSGKVEHVHKGDVVEVKADSTEIKKPNNELNALLAGASMSLAVTFPAQFLSQTIDKFKLSDFWNFIIFFALYGFFLYFSYLLFKNKSTEANAILKWLKWIGIGFIVLVFLVVILASKIIAN